MYKKLQYIEKTTHKCKVLKSAKFYTKITKEDNYTLVKEPYFLYIGQVTVARREDKTIKRCNNIFLIKYMPLYGLVIRKYCRTNENIGQKKLLFI